MVGGGGSGGVVYIIFIAIYSSVLVDRGHTDLHTKTCTHTHTRTREREYA